MLRHYLSSLNGKVLIVVTSLYLISLGIGLAFELRAVQIATLLYIPTAVWPWISNKMYSMVFLSWFFKKLYLVELVSFDNTRYFTLAAKYDDNKMSAPVYFSSNIGQVILLENGTVDKHSDSSYITHWLPINRNDRAMHILKYDLPS